jgi:hypothetical protein
VAFSQDGSDRRRRRGVRSGDVLVKEDSGSSRKYSSSHVEFVIVCGNRSFQFKRNASSIARKLNPCDRIPGK